jgi:Domain of unknown function (DUF4352)
MINMKKITITFVLVLVALCSCTQSKKQTFDDYNQFENMRTPPKLYESKVGQILVLADRKIGVFGFESYTENSMKTSYNTPQGIAMEVLIENISDVPFYLNPLDFTVQDADGRSLTYFDIIPGGKKPALRSEQVAPGQKIRAFITFADTKTPAVIYYKSQQGQMIKISIK